MESTVNPPTHSGRKRYVLAVVLGTALSGLAPVNAAPAVGNLSRYCNACWRNARLDPECWADCTQEGFRRLLERVEPQAWDQVLAEEGDERREFLRAIDAVKKRTQRQRRGGPLPADGVADRAEVRQQALTDEREAVRTAA